MWRALLQGRSMPSSLFTTIGLRDLTLANRIVVSPMCQYSADDGSATDWHMQHLGSLAVSGAGLVMIEATAVERAGRITHGCLGLYSDATVAPSPIALDEDWPVPRALAAADLDRIEAAFVAATRRAARLGLDLVEAHCAHGYLLHEFLSPIANRRGDAYGGSLENRMRFPLRIMAAMRAVWPAEKPLGARITGTDWLPGGFSIEDAVVFARALKAIGCDYVCVSSGGIVPKAPIPVGPGYQLDLAARVRRDAGIVARAVGLLVEAHQAEAVIASGQADMVAMARAFLDDPRWPWHAAEVLGARAAYPPQYERSRPTLWPGAKLARPVRAAE